MNKRELAMLEKVFTAEIEIRLPFQTRSKVIESLRARGFVEPMTRSFGQDGFGKIEVSGWQLTDAGRYAYCTWAAAHTSDEGE